MAHSRRGFLTGAAATIGAMPLARPAMGQKSGLSSDAILALFKSLRGDVAIKIFAPAANGKAEFLVESNASKTMFVGSAIKTFILCEALRQGYSPDVLLRFAREQLWL